MDLVFTQYYGYLTGRVKELWPNTSFKTKFFYPIIYMVHTRGVQHIACMTHPTHGAMWSSPGGSWRGWEFGGGVNTTVTSPATDIWNPCWASGNLLPRSLCLWAGSCLFSVLCNVSCRRWMLAAGLAEPWTGSRGNCLHWKGEVHAQTITAPSPCRLLSQGLTPSALTQ